MKLFSNKRGISKNKQDLLQFLVKNFFFSISRSGYKIFSTLLSSNFLEKRKFPNTFLFKLPFSSDKEVRKLLTRKNVKEKIFTLFSKKIRSLSDSKT